MRYGGGQTSRQEGAHSGDSTGSCSKLPGRYLVDCPHVRQKCGPVSIRNMHLGISMIVGDFILFFKNSHSTVSHPFLCSKRGSREADGDQRDGKERGHACAMVKP